MNTAKTGAKITPAMNPPIWAPNAMPPSEPEIELLINCKTNQKINTTKAGSLKTCKKKPNGIATLMDRFGKKTMYAPKTPEMAPLAPIIGIVDEGSGSAWLSAATVPQSK